MREPLKVATLVGTVHYTTRRGNRPGQRLLCGTFFNRISPVADDEPVTCSCCASRARWEQERGINDEEAQRRTEKRP